MGVIVYTFFGGLKATFFAEYLNAAFIFGAVLVFVTSIYFLNPNLAGIEGMYEKLTNAASLRPVAGNSEGAYLTMASTGALVFGIINIVGSFGTSSLTKNIGRRQSLQGPDLGSLLGLTVGICSWITTTWLLYGSCLLLQPGR